MFLASWFFMNNLRQRGKDEVLKLRKIKTCFFIHVAVADVFVSHYSYKIFPLFGSSRKPTSTGIQQIGNLSSAKALWCNKTFSQSIHLTTYQSIHTGDKLFACSQCDRPFSHLVISPFPAHYGTASSSLKRHQRNHTGERYFLCAQCDKNFS